MNESSQYRLSKKLRKGVRLPLLASLGITILAAMSPTLGQSKPPESASKVKKVLLYNYVGGWFSEKGVAGVKSVMNSLASEKGFELVETENPKELTSEYLNQFQVLVWNNNMNARESVPDSAARNAIIDYLRRGGGWMLIGIAGDHFENWPALDSIMGTTVIQFGSKGSAELVLDSAAGSEEEIKWMIPDLPASSIYEDVWLTFKRTVRPLPGVGVVAVARRLSDDSAHQVALPGMRDHSDDFVYIWTRQGTPEVGEGRFLYNGMGFLEGAFLADSGALVAKFYWENLRWAAGDYQNGCTDPESPEYDPEARVWDGCVGNPLPLKDPPRALREWNISLSGRRLNLHAASSGSMRLRLRDLRGAVVWSRKIDGPSSITLDEGIGGGVYQLEADDPGFRPMKLFLP